jgi:hypothetical protein
MRSKGGILREKSFSGQCGGIANTGISYRELEEMMGKRGVHLDHTTMYRWAKRYAPEIEKRLRWAWRRSGWRGSWHVDETYIKIRGQLLRYFPQLLRLCSSAEAISEHTAKFHVSSILAKLGAASRTEAVTIGMTSGLVAI